MNSTIKQIVKRDGTVVAYDRDRISIAIFKAAAAVSEFDRPEADRIAQLVEQRLLANFGKQSTPSVEIFQIGGRNLDHGKPCQDGPGLYPLSS